MLESFLQGAKAALLILMLASIGYYFGAKGYIKEHHKPFIVKLIVSVVTPCLVIVNFNRQFSKELLFGSWTFVLAALVSMLLMFGFAILLARALKLDKRKRGGFVVMCALANNIFIGYPVCHELFGDAGTPYVMMFYFANTMIFWTLGYKQLYDSGHGQGEGQSLGKRLKKLVNPPIVTLLISIVLLLLDIKLPEFIVSFCEYPAAMSSPLALMYMGYVIYEYGGIKSLRMTSAHWWVLLLRNVVSPAVMIIMMTLLGMEKGVTFDVFAMESAMPVMTLTVIVSASTGADEAFAASGITISTVACLAVIPLMMAVLSIL